MKKLRATALIIKDGKAVFLEREDGLWTFPGGKVDPGETPEQSCVRETAEEAGIEVETFELLDIRVGSKYDTHCYICKYISGELATTEPDKFTCVEWVDIKDILALSDEETQDLTPAIRQHLEDQIKPNQTCNMALVPP